MNNKEELIKNIRYNWLYSLLSLSDIDFQKKRWLNRDIKNPAYTYVEFFCSYFDDVLHAGYPEMITQGFFTEEEYQAIKEFHKLLDLYQEPNGDAYDHQSILQDENWVKVTDVGVNAMKNLKQIITDPEELKIFNEKLYAPDLSEGDFTWGEYV